MVKNDILIKEKKMLIIRAVYKCICSIQTTEIIQY